MTSLLRPNFRLSTGVPADFKAPRILIDYKQALTRLGKGDETQKIGVHFYMDDELLEQFVRNFDNYLERLKKFSCVLTPDFSIISQMDSFCKKCAVYRSRKLGQLMQKAGITVVTTLQWEDENTFDFCFADVPKNNVVSISTVGIARTPVDSPTRAVFRKGFREALKRLTPSLVLLYRTLIPECEFDGVPYLVYPNSHFPRSNKDNGKESNNG